MVELPLLDLVVDFHLYVLIFLRKQNQVTPNVLSIRIHRRGRIHNSLIITVSIQNKNTKDYAIVFIGYKCKNLF